MFWEVFRLLGQVHTWASLSGTSTPQAICYDGTMPTQKKAQLLEPDMQPQQADSPSLSSSKFWTSELRFSQVLHLDI